MEAGTVGRTNRRIGTLLYGAASVAAGVFDLIWGEFEPAHQPIQALGDHIAGVTMLVYLGAIWLITGGAAMVVRRTAPAGALALAIIYAVFGAAWLPRLYTAPQALGHHVGVYIGIAAGIGTQAILVVAAAIVYSSRTAGQRFRPWAARTARWVFGLSAIAFGLGHLTSVAGVARMVPAWLPPGADFWVVFTGIAFVLAGLGIVSGVLDVLAARLLAAMLLVFSALALAPGVFTSPRDHVSWGASAYNLTAVAAAWIVGTWLSEGVSEG